MPFTTLKMFTFLAVNLIIYAPKVLSQGFPDLTGLPDLSNVPKCAVTCTMNAYFTSASQACPQISDVACFCKNQEFIRTSRACMTSTCPPDFLPQAATFASQTCASAGVILPDSVIAKPNAPAASTTVASIPTPVPTTTAAPTVPTPKVIVSPTTTAIVTAPTGVALPAPVIPVPVVSNPVPAPIQTFGNVINTTTSTPIVANNPSASKPSTSQKDATPNSPIVQSSPAVSQSNETPIEESSDSAETSGAASSSKAFFSLLIVGTMVATLQVL